MTQEEFLRKCEEYGIELTDKEMTESEMDDFCEAIKNIFNVTYNLKEIERIVDIMAKIPNE